MVPNANLFSTKFTGQRLSREEASMGESPNKQLDILTYLGYSAS